MKRVASISEIKNNRWKSNINLPSPNGLLPLTLTAAIRGSSVDDFPLKLWRPRVLTDIRKN